jgi:guanosine-3',5'-bis(diphosphate) 3'-pyrophosphohydrolase
VEAAVARSPLLRDALQAAAEAHAGQVRNGSGGLPYIEHPKMVAEQLAAAGYGDEVLAAALLHDVVEDSELTVADLRERFGAGIANLVEVLSDDQEIEPYRERKDEHRGRIESYDGDALAIYGADKLTNVSTLRAALAREGAAVPGEFKVPLELKLEVWEADAELLRRLVPELAFLQALGEELSGLRADLAAPRPAPRG